ncbi:hypothetical protein FRC12_016801 [Ceratobasidium sp. 428]|nr:hypothetical protein FRC12_016801 [Ceratobasidium sp. 428]
MGKKIFQSLQHRHAAQNLIASMTDNGSNNRTMNRQIYKQIRGQPGNRLSERNMSILCACHAWHLTCSNLLSELDVVEVTEEEDGYDVAKAFDLGERIEESEEIRQEEARMRRLDGEDTSWIPDEESDDDFDDIEPDNDPVEGDPLAGDLRQSTQAKNSANPQKQRTKALNPIQKIQIHAIAVHCTSSPQRQKIMAGYIRLYCFVVLAVIKSMAIRWNTVLAELRRALLLRPTNTLEIGKTGKARQAALQLKQELTMSDTEWEVVAEVVQILQPFEEATLSFSKHGKPHLPDVLPTFMKLHTELQNSRQRLQKEYGAKNDPYGLIRAISAGEHKLEKYFKIALQNDSVLVSSILHPGMRLRFFQDEHMWGDMMRRGKELIAGLFETYKLETPNTESPNQPSLRPGLHTSWSDQLLQLSGASKSDLDDELSWFFGNVYAYKPGTNILVWWREHELDFPVLSRIA